MIGGGPLRLLERVNAKRKMTKISRKDDVGVILIVRLANRPRSLRIRRESILTLVQSHPDRIMNEARKDELVAVALRRFF